MVRECMGAIACSTIAVFQMPNASSTPQMEVSYWMSGRRPKSLKAKKLPPGECFTEIHLFFNQSESFVQKVRVKIVQILYLIYPVFWCGMGKLIQYLISISNFEVIIKTLYFELNFCRIGLHLPYKIMRIIGKLKSFIVKMKLWSKFPVTL